KTATHALVYARLITPDGKDHGLHAFVTPIRDPRTLCPFPGVSVGDMGEKAGLNGVDNGFVIFDKYRIPRENLLNKGGDVTPEGKYVSPFKDSNKRFGAALGMLSQGRVSIVSICVAYLSKALPIAIRYSAVRRQFGVEADKELPVLEYQLQVVQTELCSHKLSKAYTGSLYDVINQSIIITIVKILLWDLF
ncbi:acyl-Coenzyme A oxidase, partial [Homalodisca vitripennis]